MLNNLTIKKKLMIFPILFIGLFIVLGSVYSYYKDLALSRNDIAINIEELNNQLLKGRISAYQFLRNPNNDTAQKVRNDFDLLKKDALEVKNHLNLEENRKHIDSIVSFSNEYITDFDKFSTLRIKDFSNGIKDESPEIKPTIASMVKIGISLENELLAINKSASSLRDEAFDTMNNMILIISIISIIIFLLLSTYISKSIVSLLNIFQDGLFSFFAYLNRESPNVQLIKIDSSDEFGNMAKIVNQNIQMTQKGVEEDRRLIDETINVLSEFEQGDLCQRLNISVSNPALMELKSVLNQMANNLEANIDNVLNILEQYSNYNYLNKIPTKDIKEHLLKLATGVNTLGDSITQMLVENKANGLTLEESSNILLSNVDKLNVSSNEAAASLEETAAALEEITSNIRNTTNNIAKMSILSSSVTKSSTNGEQLANKTTIAMDEINNQVNLINEAISVIDQIAFQTNILSLNAAVEAATAGEAGKGFAVVAQEVRNLAARSAEAAKEIKNIVENAKNKADEGKEIASHMISGYKELNENIQQTTNLISDIEMSSKEQLTGIEQINDAVNQLDQQTQQNAQIASQTHDIAVLTDEIAKLVVHDADTKEFLGKKEVKAKSLNTKNDHSNNHITPKNDFIKTTTTKVAPKTITSSNSNDEWESF